MRRRDRWQTGWVPLPGTRQTHGVHYHRPHPDRPEATVCDRVIRGQTVVQVARPGIPLCTRCENFVRNTRRRTPRGRR
jgi:hypothetical protein